jgi:Sec-independent protein secretion pathway component TatC
MSLPIYVLYEIGILGARLFGRKRGTTTTDLTET